MKMNKVSVKCSQDDDYLLVNIKGVQLGQHEVRGLRDRIIEAEEKVVKQVLLKLLGRDATEKDAKKCSKIFRDVVHGYELAYENTLLGKIVLRYDKYSAGVDFIPKHKYLKSSSNLQKQLGR